MTNIAARISSAHVHDMIRVSDPSGSKDTEQEMLENNHQWYDKKFTMAILTEKHNQNTVADYSLHTLRTKYQHWKTNSRY